MPSSRHYRWVWRRCRALRWCHICLAICVRPASRLAQKIGTDYTRRVPRRTSAGYRAAKSRPIPLAPGYTLFLPGHSGPGLIVRMDYLQANYLSQGRLFALIPRITIKSSHTTHPRTGQGLCGTACSDGFHTRLECCACRLAILHCIALNFFQLQWNNPNFHPKIAHLRTMTVTALGVLKVLRSLC